MSLPDINKTRLQRVVADCETTFEPADFDELCDAVAETPWATKLELNAGTIAKLIQHHEIETSVKVVMPKAAVPPPRKLKKSTPEPVVAAPAPKPEPVAPPPKPEPAPVPAPPAPPAAPAAAAPKGNVFDEAGKGRKQCLVCKKYVGVRNAQCPNCGHAFGSKVVEPPPAPAPETKPFVPAPLAQPKPIVMSKPFVPQEDDDDGEAYKPAKVPLSLHKEPIRQESTNTLGGSTLNREFLHDTDGSVWEIQNGQRWLVDKRTLEPVLNLGKQHKYCMKMNAEWNASFLTNIESDVPLWVEQGLDWPPCLPRTWKKVAELQEERNREQEAVAAGNSGNADAAVSESAGE